MNQQLLSKLKRNPLVLQDKITRPEMIQEMDDFQATISQLVFPNDDPSSIQTDDIKCRITYLARKYGIENDPVIIDVANELNDFHKEMSITKSGQIGEDILSSFINKSHRPSTYSFKNITLYDEATDEETEIDNLILTDDGLIILEAKRVKENVTLDHEGHLVHANGECYDRNKSVTSKMKLKRNLLEKKLEELGINFNYKIDTCLVLITPLGKNIKCKNLYGRQKIKYVNQIPSLIEHFSSYYSLKSEQKDQLLNALSNMETNKKQDFIKFDYVQMVTDLEEALSLLEYKQIDAEKQIHPQKEIHPKQKKRKFFMPIPAFGFGCGLACAFGLSLISIPVLFRK